MSNTGPSDSDRIATLESRVQAIEDKITRAIEIAKGSPILAQVTKMLFK